MEKTPAQVFVSFARADEDFVHQLKRHLSVLVRQGEITVWSSLDALAGESLRDAVAKHLESAQLIIPLISPDYLASEAAFEEFEAALKRAQVGSAQVVPILVRPVDVRDSPVAKLQALPRSGTALTKWANQDEAWVEIARELRSLLKFAADRVRSEPTAAPPPTRSIDDIFQTAGPPDITFVEPAQYKSLRRYLRAMGKGLVVEGPSGVGKTTLVKRALGDIQGTEQRWLLGQVEGDRQKLDECLQKGFRGHLVIDDFHRLDQARQARVADAMKVVADRDARDAKLTVIGINPVGDSLVGALSDLAGRFDVITMGRQPEEKISELIQKGEDAANIRFGRRQEFVVEAAGSFFTAQQLCREAAHRADIEQTLPVLTRVDVGFRDIVEDVVRELEGKYFGALRAFACHDERVPPRGAGLALLWLLAQSAEGHVVLDDVRFQFSDPDVRDALARLKSSYLSKCFDDTPSLKNLLYYNKNAGVLSIEDPRLAFYLRNMSWPKFIERTGHRSARIDVENKLSFAKRRPSDRPAEPERVVNVLHLSDLHFSHLQQADVWYGQLAEDLRELECERLDVLVLSGDLTQRADKGEFEAARRFLLRLSTETRLSPGQLVLVPGNHDLSWPLSKASYVLRRREEHAGALEEGRFIAHGPTVIEVRDDEAYKRRFEPFADFYGHLKGAPYSLDYAAQIDVQDFARENLLFVGLNSAWETDHHFVGRASIHPEALAQALDRVRRMPGYAGRLKVAVWHHALAGTGDDRIKDHGFMQQLAKAGFRLVLHGHVHKAERGLFRYDMAPDGRRIDVVGAGTFGAPTAEWVPGYPLQYNLLRIKKDRVVVETRRREEPNGAWQPDARWLQRPGKDPLPRYEIELDGAGVESSRAGADR